MDEVRWRAAKWAISIMLIIIGMIFTFVYLSSRREELEMADLMKRGQQTQGVVTSSSMRRGRSGIRRRHRRRTYYTLVYAFTANGQQYHGEEDLGQEGYETLPAGAKVTVWYLPGNPNVNSIDPGRYSSTLPLLGMISGYALGFAGLIYCIKNVKPS